MGRVRRSPRFFRARKMVTFFLHLIFFLLTARGIGYSARVVGYWCRRDGGGPGLPPFKLDFPAGTINSDISGRRSLLPRSRIASSLDWILREGRGGEGRDSGGRWGEGGDRERHWDGRGEEEKKKGERREKEQRGRGEKKEGRKKGREGKGRKCGGK